MSKFYANEKQKLDQKSKDNIQKQLEVKFQEIFDIMNIDTQKDHNTNGTAKRLAKMYVKEIFRGCFEDFPSVTTFPNHQKYDQIIVSGPNTVKSMCSHHFMPIHGKCWIGYIPGENVIGLSKFSRIIDDFSRRPQIQEELTEQIKKYFVDALKPKGLIVVIKANHMCMTHRGVNESDESVMTTSAIYGAFEENATRKEFFDMIRG